MAWTSNWHCPAMTGKILKDNGQFLCRSTFKGLNTERLEPGASIGAKDAFSISIIEKTDRPTLTEDLADFDQDAVTPEYEVYQAR